MNDEVGLRHSVKMALHSREHYIVTVGEFVCLRILGNGSDFEVMTATADEDDKSYVVPADRELLIEVGKALADALGVKPVLCRDNYDRDYIKICRFRTDEEGDRLIETFKKVLHEGQKEEPPDSDAIRELREIYDAVAPDDSGDDAYLEDGVWISSDGKTKDLGR